MQTIRLLYLTAEEWPTFRVDLSVLFGQELPALGVQTDLVTEQKSDAPAQAWSGGQAHLCQGHASKALNYVHKFWHLVRHAWAASKDQVDAIQVRDMPVVAALALIAARCRGLRFFYWMSYPQSEGQIDRARRRGPRAGMRYWFPLLQGTVGKWLLYRFVMRWADHVFVQSDQMLEDVAGMGVDRAKLTPVPMGVDPAKADPAMVLPHDDPHLQGRRPIVYLGTLDASRNIDILVRCMQKVRQEVPDALLVLAGDINDHEQREHVRQLVCAPENRDAVWWTGWQPMDTAWRIVRAAEVAVSPFPRGFLLDSASPTKAMEYLALEIPVVVNDNPDQRLVVEASQSGLCVPYTEEAFSTALVQLLKLPAQARAAMGQRGRAYVTAHRSYAILASNVASVYRRVMQ